MSLWVTEHARRGYTDIGGVSAVWLPPGPEGASVPLPPWDPHHSTGSWGSEAPLGVPSACWETGKPTKPWLLLGPQVPPARLSCHPLHTSPTQNRGPGWLGSWVASSGCTRAGWRPGQSDHHQR